VNQNKLRWETKAEMLALLSSMDENTLKLHLREARSEIEWGKNEYRRIQLHAHNAADARARGERNSIEYAPLPRERNVDRESG
jgi:hypothetical protein